VRAGVEAMQSLTRSLRAVGIGQTPLGGLR
jgi:hypothetical protein